jgi:glutamate racemase
MIGVFDSGHGGLTILRALTARFPGHRYVFLGDHAHAPYGARDVEAIYDLTRDNVERLFSIGCRLVLLACNTASAVALRRLQQTWLPHFAPDNRILGVVVPTIEAVTKVPWHVTSPPGGPEHEARSVVVYATRRTVESGSYPYEIGLRAPAIGVAQQACAGLVDRIETDAPEAEIARMVDGFVAASLVEEREGAGAARPVPDTAILGCTHYPLVAAHFAAALPSGVEILDQPGIVADSLGSYLSRHPEFDAPDSENPEPRFFTTGDPGRVDPLASRFFGRAVGFERL